MGPRGPLPPPREWGELPPHHHHHLHHIHQQHHHHHHQQQQAPPPTHTIRTTDYGPRSTALSSMVDGGAPSPPDSPVSLTGHRRRVAPPPVMGEQQQHKQQQQQQRGKEEEEVGVGIGVGALYVEGTVPREEGECRRVVAEEEARGKEELEGCLSVVRAYVGCVVFGWWLVVWFVGFGCGWVGGWDMGSATTNLKHMHILPPALTPNHHI
jgi:hypothetical protein